MDPTIETVIDKTVADPTIAARIKDSTRVVDGQTHLDLSALINSSDMVNMFEPEFISWVSGLGFEWQRIGEETQAGLLDAYCASGKSCNFMYALPESMKSKEGYAEAYRFGVSMETSKSLLNRTTAHA
jgi:hypothetical protein